MSALIDLRNPAFALSVRLRPSASGCGHPSLLLEVSMLSSGIRLRLWHLNGKRANHGCATSASVLPSALRVAGKDGFEAGRLDCGHVFLLAPFIALRPWRGMDERVEIAEGEAKKGERET